MYNDLLPITLATKSTINCKFLGGLSLKTKSRIKIKENLLNFVNG